MKEVIKEYGEALLEAAVVGLLMVFLLIQITDGDGNSGVFCIVGAQMDNAEIYEGEYTDFDVYETDARRKAPVITYSGSNRIGIGECQLDAYLTAVGEGGSVYPVKVISIVNETGDSLAVSEDSRVVFHTSGIYFATVRAVDDIGKETVSVIRIPVNKGG